MLWYKDLPNAFKIIIFLVGVVSFIVSTFYHMYSRRSTNKYYFIVSIFFISTSILMFLYIFSVSYVFFINREVASVGDNLAFIPIIFFTLDLCELITSIVFIFKLRKEYHEKISVFSIREAYENINSGVFYYDDKECLFINTFMLNVIRKTFTRTILNGNSLWESITHGKYDRVIKNSYVYLVEDVYYSFRKGENSKYKYIYCQDLTEEIKMNDLLLQQEKQMIETEEELKKSFLGIEEYAAYRQQEIIKNKMHNALAHKIAVLSRLTEGKNIDFDTIKNVPEILEEVKNNDICKLSNEIEMLQEDLGKIDVSIEIEGEISNNIKLSGLFFDIIKESATNAVRHGNASKVYVKFYSDTHFEIRNNGTKPKEIFYGGGLHGMSLRAKEAGGRLIVSNEDEFVIGFIMDENNN